MIPPVIWLGPVSCNACHAPGLFRTPKGWLQRDWTGRAVLRPRYAKHRCPQEGYPRLVHRRIALNVDNGVDTQ